MALRKYQPSNEAPSVSVPPLNLPNNKVPQKAQFEGTEIARATSAEADVDIDLREVYFLIMHFLSAGPCHRTYGQFWNELLEHQLLPRRYHAWYSRNGGRSGDENDNGLSLPLGFNTLVERYPHVEKDHLVKLLKQLIVTVAPPSLGMLGGHVPNAADVPTVLGSGPFSLLESDRRKEDNQVSRPPAYLRWPHMQADQVHGLGLREIGGGFTKHHRAPSIRAACYAIAKPSTMVQKMENIKKLRGHRDAVYCAIFDRSGRYVITGSDDRLVKIWSMETGFCLASCRGHEGDITDLAVSSNNAVVASSSNDFIIRVWRLPDGHPISVLRGHTGAVTAIAFSPRPSAVYNLLSSSDDGTCRIWDARYSQLTPRVFLPKPPDTTAGKTSGPSSSAGLQSHQILCCAYNANGTVFVTGSSDHHARVWSACKFNSDDSAQPNHEMDVLIGHENDVNYVQFSGCSMTSRSSSSDTLKEDNIRKFKNSWFIHDFIVTCSRDGSAILWIPKSRRSHGKVGRWTRACHLKVPPPPMPPQPLRGGPRQRILPTPRGVNMIIWSLDNRFVLAAIMDCRICVWNAITGELVHSLTGHSESTYVLDVHPFNPRIAMSAGYDGKTIVWDIWEGTPIRTYEIGRFKLVDGKFSPDGTSIILSDDVGQIYVLTTGQGEAQADAMYDQFFLGDYRPLIQDTHGNALDQETQLIPYRRNIQDLLCDSSMIPYPEPYQSMYQQRRLGALGIEWRPSSVKFAIGPADTSGLLDYPMLPLVDLDRIMEPLPEFLDAMDWEPENEIRSEDNDSEYNVTEEYSSEEGKKGLSTSSTGDAESSAEDSDAAHSKKDGLRRSKRKKHKGEVELMTSSGRRIKRRNLDQRDGTLLRSKSKKQRTGKKNKKKKSSISKSLRSQRVAARNCLHNVSLWTGVSSEEEDEEEDVGGSETDSSDSEPMLQDSDIESNESDRSTDNVHDRHFKGKAPLLEESNDFLKAGLPESQSNNEPRKKLVLKLPNPGSKKTSAGSIKIKCEKQTDLAGSSSKAHHKAVGVESYPSYQDPRNSSGNGRELEESEDVEDHLTSGWGEVKARRSKRCRPGEALPSDLLTGSKADVDDHNAISNSVNMQEEHGAGTSQNQVLTSHEEFAPLESAKKSKSVEKSDMDDSRLNKGTNLVSYTENLVNEPESQCGPSQYMGEDKMPFENGTDGREKVPRVPKFRIISKTVQRDQGSCSKLNSVVAFEDPKNAEFDSGTPSRMEQASDSGVRLEDERTSMQNSDNGDENDLQKINASRLSISQGLNRRHSDSDKMFCAVYSRSKTHKAKSNSEGDGCLEESTSNASSYNHDQLTDFPETATDGTRRTRSMKGTALDLNNTSSPFKLKNGHGSAGTSSRASKRREVNAHDQLLGREWRSDQKITVGLRSTRNRREDYLDMKLSSVDKRSSRQTTRKLSWLMLSEHEESYRYIPQQGDQVVYLVQGHEEYEEKMHLRRSTEHGAWRSLKGNLKAAEFCKVVGLEYSTVPGSGESCCKLTLEFIDPNSKIRGRTVKVTLPELNNFGDFIVERTMYDAAISRKWARRDKCQVWWKNEGEEGGSWWDGRIHAEKAKSLEFPDSPWERYTIVYKNDIDNDQHQHSPWELHEVGTQWEHPRIDDHARITLLNSFLKLERTGSRYQETHGVNKLKQIFQKEDYFNRFPVPLSLEIIQLRLQNNYYRTLEAVQHDFQVMITNANSYISNKRDISTKLIRLSEWFELIISSL